LLILLKRQNLPLRPQDSFRLQVATERGATQQRGTHSSKDSRFGHYVGTEVYDYVTEIQAHLARRYGAASLPKTF
jgi:hypothetical protein